MFRQADLNLPWPVATAVADLITCSLVLEHIGELDFIFRVYVFRLKWTIGPND